MAFHQQPDPMWQLQVQELFKSIQLLHVTSPTNQSFKYSFWPSDIIVDAHNASFL
ncbi:hypothetical protein ABFA07_000946 [Porites harrisoni]